MPQFSLVLPKRRFGQRLLDQALVRRAVKRLADYLLCRVNRQAGELLAELGDGVVAFELDLVPSSFQQSISLLLCLLPAFFLQPLSDRLRLRDDRLTVTAGGLDLLLRFAVCRLRLLATAFGGRQA
ncbi:MAG TPA: hypothetical protein VI759_01010, partial [Dehalococcoidia bacterium]|nr:hypothetical protein [Dehalococcoidia bacterium]